MKINKKLLALMMTFVIGGTVLTGCGQKASTEDTTIEQSTDNSTEESDNNVTDDNATGEETNENVDQNTDESFSAEDPTVSKETFFVVTDGIELPATVDMPEEMFADTYGIDPELLASYSVNMPMMNVTATEIAVFEVKDEASIEAVKAGIEKRQKALEEQWQSYLPEQLELVQNYKVAVKDNLVLFVISEHADQIVETFEK
ncbi:MAG: DUF4358 domain-containing protein [Candidatus Cellulosilyticum pullistercoris]|uniref:DUF4358 domain-containing protein n=1 Tax=Candidatus Cellulosilyticum pullistercoris TaxID=2838521 RepID=A0A9E2NLG4_9FIRM|nr:DUF4358 domain-containing protein [Candidatus Cellulosilyticum pullistercoris]